MIELRWGDLVEKTGGDYEFRGRIVADFMKFTRDFTAMSQERRFVVQDDRGALHVYSAKNLRRVE